MTPRRVVVVGGVAGGVSAAARLRRLDEFAEIIVVERGSHVSFANCGLPYFIGREIADADQLLVQTPQGLRDRFCLDVRIRTEAISFDTNTREIRLREVDTEREYSERYDVLVLSTGAAPLRPPIPGINRDGHFALRNIPDAERMEAHVSAHPGARAVVVGGGYIGLEVAEQLSRRGAQVTIIEALPQVAAFLDPEMAALIHKEIRSNGVTLLLGDGVASFDEPTPEEGSAASTVVLRSGARVPADMVLLGIGVKPEIELARSAGLTIGSSGGIAVDDHMRTSDPLVYAVGDAVEVRHGVTGQRMLLPLAGPANRQGRIAADNISGIASRYEATFGTGIMRVFGLTVAATGANSRMLEQAEMPFSAVHLHPLNHAGYYPGAVPLALKLLYSPCDGRALGAQVVGAEGVDKRIDVLAVAIQTGMTVERIAQLELAYAPPFGSAKDPVNLAAMVAENVRAGLATPIFSSDLAKLDPAAALLLDVRDDDEWAEGHLPNAVHIPLPELRTRIAELPTDKEIVVYCRSGQRSYYGCRILCQRGYDARNLSGAYLTWVSQNAPVR